MTFPSFSNGEVLNSSDMNAVGLWLVKTQTIGTAVSSVTVSGAFSSTYDNYLVTVTGGVGSTVAVMRVQLGATATGYFQSGFNVAYTGITSVITTNNGTTFESTGVVTTDSIMMSFHLWGPNLAKRTYIESTYIFGAVGGFGDSMKVMGYVNNTTQYTAFTISPSSGTLTGGTIRVYGYRN